MRATITSGLLAVAACGSPKPRVALDGIPVIPVGYDAYRRLDLLPQIHILDRAYMRSTYDRAGGNEAADASHFLRQESDGMYTALDVAGEGMLVFWRANHWHGSPWHIVVDTNDHVVWETSTSNPEFPVASSVFLPTSALPSPLAITWPTTQGADLDWVPKPFTSSLRFSDGRTDYGTGYYIYHLYPQGADHLSAPLAAWDGTPPPADVRDLVASAGTDIAPPGDEQDASVDVLTGTTAPVLDLTGPAVIRRFAIDAPADEALALANVHVQVTWDGRDTPSIDAPIGLLFAGGSLYDRDDRAQLTAGLLANVTFAGDRVQLALYLPMPFQTAAQIALVGTDSDVSDVHVAVRTVPDALSPTNEGYLHATYIDQGTPVPGQDLVLLDTTQTEGGSDWCGAFVGTSFTFSDAAYLGTLEGDPRMFFDDATSPQGYGTGTEEWGGGGDYWGGQTVTLPLAGHPTGAPSFAEAQSGADAIESAYRFLIADAMPFGKNARIQLEHGGVDDSVEHYRTVTYWYGRPAACLVQSDTLHIGDSADEAAHGYSSPNAPPAATVTSRWDGLGVDAEDPVETDTVRTLTGAGTTTTFTVAIDPSNRGALLRRKLDYSVTDQRAEVFVADASGTFQPAGTWFLAGSTTCVFSDPPGELDPGVDTVETVDRRWREDEFLIPRALTEGRSSITIQLRVAPGVLPLYRSAPTPLQAPAWTEARYTIYSYVL